jgi:hypothetical protein
VCAQSGVVRRSVAAASTSMCLCQTRIHVDMQLTCSMQRVVERGFPDAVTSYVAAGG